MYSPKMLTRRLSAQLHSRQLVQAGFTMIELLVVIAILGILAVAVLSAINPIEQINRGRDTASQSDAEQLLSAIDRYVAFQGYLPWQSSPDSTTRELAWGEFTDTLVDDGAPTACAVYVKLGEGDTNCEGAGELKATFFNRILRATTPNANPLYVYRGAGVSDSTYACFVPQSQAFMNLAVKRCGTAGDGLPTDVDATTADLICPADPAGTFYCIP